MILTDQDPWMKQAIETEMPYTKHAFCIWHITAKFSGWFNSVLRSEYSSWCTEFYNLYKLQSVEEFEQKWPLVDLAIENVGHKQMHDSMLAKYQELHLRSLSPLEKQGYQVLTPFAFKKCQDQLALAIQYSA
ncbi:hypothetical protein QVD17_19841 [Tagetes erecta]|uniref:Protein FAR1-RELATED SEQUENCE n=1 Tax=Tagetes erecta TaxID=13708 RepID=A0AAD8KNS7_TARER|nr:hypothetical protein QVD17_19841 [Tagetes erecta]